MTSELKLTFSFRMSDKSKRAPGSPWSTPRTPLKIPKSLTQDEDVSQDTIRKNDRISVEDTTRVSLRNSVEDTTRISLSHNDEDPRALIKDLEEDTSGIPLVTEVGRRNLVEDTTRIPSGLRDLEGNTSSIPLNHKKEEQKTPMKNRVGTRNLEEDTPRIPLDLLEEGQKDPRLSTSPATSTPGASPAGSTSGELRDSELQSSEESVIESSITKEESKKEEENDDTLIIKMISTSLAENSEVEEESHNAEDTSWETTLEESTLQDGEIKSCVAQRTRSQTELLRKLNLSQLLEACPISLNESFEVIGTIAVDSLNLPRNEIDGTEWEDRKEWCGNLHTLNISLDKASKIRGTQKQEEMTRIYKRKTAEVARENEEMKHTYEDAADSLEEEKKKVKSVTFLVEEPKYATALEEVIKALETLVGLNLSNAPIRNIENIIKIILSICIDYSAQVQATQETMRTMAKLIRELIINRYRVELMNEEIKKIEGEKQAAIKEVENFKKYNKALREVTDSVMDVEKNENRDIVVEIAECRAQITELESNAKEREEKYTNAYTRKEHYKTRTEDLEKELAKLEEKMKKEKETEANEKQTRNTEMQGLMDGYESMKEGAFRMEEEMGELRVSHKAEIANIMENQAIQSEMENGRRLEAEKKMIDQEAEVKRVRSEYNKKLRAKDSEIKEAKKKKEEDKDTLDEQEKMNKSLWDMIDAQKEEIELKDLEIDAFRYYNLLFGEKDNKVIFDPENPRKRFKPRTEVKTTEDKDDGMGSELNNTTDVSNVDLQSSTAGVLGDTDGCMDTTLGQDNTTIETQTPNQRGSKRKKVEMVGAGKVDERDKEKPEESSEESCSTYVSEDEKEPNKKKKVNKNRTNNRGITQRELDRKMEEIKKEHHRQLKEQEKKNEESMEALKKEMELKSSQDIESLRQSLSTEGMEVQRQKPEEAGREEPMEGTIEQEEVQDPKISSQERETIDQTNTQTQSQNSDLGAQTPVTQNSGKQGQATPVLGDPSTQNREEGNLNSAQATPVYGDPSTQNREKGKPYIVSITEENRNRVSKDHRGMLLNLDGTLTMTPQYWTWSLNSNIQLQNMLETMPEFPAEITNKDHPEATILHLIWTHEGEWVVVPYDKLDVGPEYKDSRIARIEKYIDLEGKIRRAVSYGEEEAKLNVWFNIEDIKTAFPNWLIPTPSPFYNGRRFNPSLRRHAKGVGNPGPNPNPQPRDQSAKDIQGRKGKYQAPKNKGYKGNQPRENTQTYQDWDRQQRAGTSAPKKNQHWEQDSWSDYKQVTEGGKGARPKEYQSRDQSWDQSWDQQQTHTQRQSQQRQHSGPVENYQRDSEERRRDRGSQSQGYDYREPQQGYQTKEYEERRRYREVSRDRQGDRRQRERSMSPRRQRNRSPSPVSSGRGRGGGQRERSNSTWSDNDGGRGRGYDRRGNDAGYGGS